MRVNARLDGASGRKLAYLERQTGWSISEIVRKALDAYYSHFKSSKGEPRAVLERSGFIGCADGPRELSNTYKDHLPGLSNKHGHR
jgi:hypothetical protein